MRYARHARDSRRSRWISGTAVVLAGCLLGYVNTQAAADHWTVAAVDGAVIVSVEQDVERAARRGHPVVAGATVVTGDGSTVMLARRGDSIIVYENSEVTIPDASGGDQPDVVQSLGNLLYRIETREARRFEVRTPFLVATVTGTVFTVAVAADRATVSVARGVVRVAAAHGEHGSIVRAGNRASVNVASTDQVTLETVDPDDASFWNSGRARGGPAPGQFGADPSQGGNPPGDDSRGGGPRGDDSRGKDSRGNDSRGNDSRGSDAQGGQSQGSHR